MLNINFRIKNKEAKMLNNIFKKSLHLALAAVFTLTTVAQAAPLGQDTLRSPSLINEKGRTEDIIGNRLKAASAGDNLSRSVEETRLALSRVSKTWGYDVEIITNTAAADDNYIHSLFTSFT